MIKTITYQDSTGHKPYVDWLHSLTDKKAKARILVRVNRMAAGNFGDCRPLRDGVQELRIDRAIKQAIDYLNDWKQRGKP